MTYNHDKKEPGPPQRMAGPDIPAAMLALGRSRRAPR
jgi:hypothetical protein